jgi:hypothetical protein
MRSRTSNKHLEHFELIEAVNKEIEAKGQPV